MKYTGYVTYVTEVRISNKGNSYFSIFFQIGEFTTNGCVCFYPERHSLWKALEGREVTTKFSGEKAGNWIHDEDTPILVGRKSLHFPIKLFNTIKEIRMDEAERKVNAKGQIISVKEGKVNVRIYTGEFMDRQIFMVDDGSSEEMRLAAFGDAIDELEVGRRYSFNNITVKMWEGNQNLLTNPVTVITEVDDEEEDASEDEEPF